MKVPNKVTVLAAIEGASIRVSDMRGVGKFYDLFTPDNVHVLTIVHRRQGYWEIIKDGQSTIYNKLTDIQVSAKATYHEN